MVVVVGERNNFGPYGLVGMAAVYLVYAAAWFLGAVKPLDQFQSVVTGLGFISLALVFSLILFSALSRLGANGLVHRLGLILLKAFFAILSESLLVLALFAVVALVVSLTELRLHSEFLFPGVYLLLSLWNKVLVWIILKRKEVVLLLFAASLLSFFAVFATGLQIVPLTLFVFFLSPIIFKVFTVDIPSELQAKIKA